MARKTRKVPILYGSKIKIHKVNEKQEAIT